LDSKIIIEAFSALAKEKSIDKEHLTNIIEEVFMSLILKKYGEEYEDKFSIIVNMERGEIEIYQEKDVVSVVSDKLHEISIDDVTKVDNTLKVGDIYIDIISIDTFGRRLINTGKQFLIQKINDVKKKAIYDDYYTKIDDICTAYVHQIQRDRIFLSTEQKIEILLPKSEQIPNDRYRRGDQVRGIIKSVEYLTKGPEIILSRNANKYLEKLFELEVPEIEDGIIEIRKVSRIPGDRSKVLVYSSDRRIDAVGACVGMKGSRIQSIVRELNGEKIDIINFSERPEILISRALSPAKPINLYLDEKKPYALAVFNDDELAQAIGINGSNIKLTTKVSGYEIDAVSLTEYNKSQKYNLTEISKITNKVRKTLSDNNIDTTTDFFNNMDQILEIKGFGPKSVENIKIAIEEFIIKQ